MSEKLTGVRKPFQHIHIYAHNLKVSEFTDTSALNVRVCRMQRARGRIHQFLNALPAFQSARRQYVDFTATLLHIRRPQALFSRKHDS